jgi:DNA-binding MarR family transcriptional regulator
VDDGELVVALRKVVTATERERLRMAREVLNIGLTEMLACGYISDNGPRTPSELAERLQITTASVTELVDRLQRNGLVARIRHPTDRRKLLVTLTADGELKSKLLQDRFVEVMAHCTTDLTLSERMTVLTFLRSATSVLESATRMDTAR